MKKTLLDLSWLAWKVRSSGAGNGPDGLSTMELAQSPHDLLQSAWREAAKTWLIQGITHAFAGPLPSAASRPPALGRISWPLGGRASRFVEREPSRRVFCGVPGHFGHARRSGSWNLYRSRCA